MANEDKIDDMKERILIRMFTAHMDGMKFAITKNGMKATLRIVQPEKRWGMIVMTGSVNLMTVPVEEKFYYNSSTNFVSLEMAKSFIENNFEKRIFPVSRNPAPSKP